MGIVEKWASEDDVWRFLIVWGQVEMPDRVGYDGEGENWMGMDF